MKFPGSILSAENIYKAFVPNHEKITAPLYNRLKSVSSSDAKKKSNTSIEINEEAYESFEKLKDALCSVPILAIRVEGRKFSIDTHASNFHIGHATSNRPWRKNSGSCSPDTKNSRGLLQAII